MSDERIFTDADLERLIELFWAKIQREVGKGILKGLWSAFIGFIIGACAIGLAAKFKFISFGG
jgi:hypothetical protein